jgi:peroxin-5
MDNNNNNTEQQQRRQPTTIHDDISLLDFLENYVGIDLDTSTTYVDRLSSAGITKISQLSNESLTQAGIDVKLHILLIMRTMNDHQQAVQNVETNNLTTTTTDESFGKKAPDAALLSDLEYQLTPNNKYSQNKQAYELGVKYFEQGQLQDALMAMHAAVELDRSNSDAWYLLGRIHQELDEDQKAILCLQRALSHNSTHLPTLLAVGVSYVNELDHNNALKTLRSWVQNHPAFQHLEVENDIYSDGSMMDDLLQLMLKAEQHDPGNSDVQEVLGVLYNISRDYDAAIKAFRKALVQRPNDYTLWNKIGATYANGSKSEESIANYLRAVELRPGYARSLLNLGISYANMGNYTNAVKAYVQALILSPGASHIWAYLRICFTCMDRVDLIPLADSKDLDILRKEFNV